MSEGLWDEEAQVQHNPRIRIPELEMGERQDRCLQGRNTFTCTALCLTSHKPMPGFFLAVGVILGRIPGGTKHEQGLDGIYPALLKMALWDQGLCKFTQEFC